MADRFVVVSHVRRFLTQGERTWINAERNIAGATRIRERTAAQANRTTAAGERVNARYTSSLTREQSALQRASRGQADYAGSMSRSTRETNQATAALGRYERQARRSATAARTAQRQQSRAPIAAGAGAVAGGSRAGVGLVAGLGLGFGAAAVAKDALHYQTALRDVGAIADVSGKKLATLGAVTRKVGLATAAGATAATKAANELVKGGISIKDVSGGALKSAIELGRAGGVAMEDAANTMARAISTFKLKGTDASHVADLFANSANATTASIGDMVAAFQQGSAASQAAGLDINDTMLALTLLAKRGVQASDAGTSLKSAMVQIAAPSKQAKATMKELNLQFFDAKGKIKSVTEISALLEERLGGLSNQQQISTLKSLAGTDGFRALFAMMKTGEKDTAKLAKSILKEGEAHRIATARLKDAQGAMDRFKAAREEMSIIVATPLLGSLATAAEGATKALQSPNVRKQFKLLGEDLGEQGDKLAKGFSEHLTSPEFAKDIDAFTKVLGTMADTASTALGVLGKLHDAFMAIPDPVREAALAFGVYAAAVRVAGRATGIAALRNAGLASALGAGAAGTRAAGGVGGAAGGAAGAGGGAGAGARVGMFGAMGQAQRMAASERTLLAQQQAANQRLTRATQQMAEARARSVAADNAAARAAAAARRADPGPNARPSVQRRFAAHQAERQAAADTARRRAAMETTSRQEARASYLAQMRQRDALARDAERTNAAARRGVITRAVPRPTAGGVGKGAAIVGGGALAATALSGGSVAGGAMAGAAIGSVGGPWGAVGTAIAGAAGVGLMNWFKKHKEQEATEFGESIALGMAKGLDKGSQERITKLAKEATDARAAAAKAQRAATPQALADGSGGTSAPTVKQIQAAKKAQAASVRADQSMGTAVGTATTNKLKKAKFVDLTSAVRDMKEKTAGFSEAAKRAAAQPLLAYVAQMEKSGRQTKGATERVAKQIGQGLSSGLNANLKMDSLTSRIKAALDSSAAAVEASKLRKAFRRQQDMFGIDMPSAAKRGYASLVKTTQDQMAKLLPLTRRGPKEQREAAAKEYKQLNLDLAKYLGASTTVVEKFGDDGSAAFRSMGKAADSAKTKVKSAAQETADALKKATTVAGDMKQVMDDMANITDAIPEVAGPPMPKPKKGGLYGGRFIGGGAVPIRVSPGEAIRTPNGAWGKVPGRPVAADNVSMVVPGGTEVYTSSGQRMLAAGASRKSALRRQRRHGFIDGGKVRGKVSWFGGPNDASTQGRKTALGLSPNIPGVAIRPGDTFESGRPYLGGYWDVHVGGRHSVIRQTDLGPHQSTGKRIDITSAALGRLGYNEKTFPTGSTGWAAYLSKSRAQAISRAASGGSSGKLTGDIVVGASKNRSPDLVEGAFGQGLQSAAGGWSHEDSKRWGSPILGEISSGLASGTYTRETDQESSSTYTKGVTPRVGKMISWARSAAKKFPKYKYGGGHGQIGQGPYDCSGFVSGILGAGGFLQAPQTTDGLKHYGDGGDGKQITVGVRGSTGKNAHTMVKLGKTFWEAGGGGNNGSVGQRKSWNRTFPTHRHPKGYASGGTVPGAAGQRSERLLARAGARTPGSPNFVGWGLLRGGVVRGYKNGGKVPKAALRDIGGVSVMRGLATGGADYYKALALAADEAVLSRITRTLRGLQQVISAGGDARVIARARASFSVLQNALGQRVGRSIAATTREVAARDENRTRVDLYDRIRGIDPGSTEGIHGRQRTEQTFLTAAPGARKELEKALKLANKQGTKEDIDTTRQALKDFDMQVLDSKATMAELERAGKELAQAQAEAAREAAYSLRESFAGAIQGWADLTTQTIDDANVKRYQAAIERDRARDAFEAGNVGEQGAHDSAAALLDREAQRLERRNGFTEIEMAQALAALTPDPGDDTDALKAMQGALTTALEDAKALGDTQDIIDLAGQLKSNTDALDASNAEAKDNASAVADLLRQLIEEQQRTQRAVASQDLASILAGTVSGYIGSSIAAQSGFPSPVRY